MKRLVAAGVTLSALAWLVAQNQSAPNTLSVYFPNDAVFYIEAANLSRLLNTWSTSPEKAAWLQSANYDVFSRSRLFQRLGDAQAEFEKAAMVPPDMSLVNAFAGGQSALAIYDIGKLEFLYITRMPSAKALETALWKARTSYQTRQASGVTFYVRTEKESKRVAAFATTKDFVLLATREDLMAGALALLTTPGKGLQGDPWFAEAIQAGKAQGDIRMVLNMPGLLKSPQFRTYWVQRNTSDLKQYRSGVIDVFPEADRIREERVFLGEPPKAVNEAAAGRLVSFVPADAGFYRAWASPDPTFVRDLLFKKLVAPGPAVVESRYAPQAADPDQQSGSAGDLEVPIDQPPLDTSSLSPSIAAVDAVLKGKTVDAVLQIQSAAPQGLFVQTPCAIVVLANSNFATATLPGALVQTRGNILIAASSQQMLDAVLARIGAPGTAVPASYSASFQIQKELPAYNKMMTSLDAAGGPQDGEPAFFSKNVASLGATLKRFTNASIVAHGNTQTVLYRMTAR